MQEVIHRLRIARNIIAENDICRNSSAIDKYGREVDARTDNTAVAFCGIGAIARACGFDFEADNLCYNAVVSQLTPRGLVDFFNTCTKEEAIALFDRAIATAEEQLAVAI